MENKENLKLQLLEIVKDYTDKNLTNEELRKNWYEILSGWHWCRSVNF